MWYFAHNLLGSVSAAGKENPILAAEVFMFKRNVLVYTVQTWSLLLLCAWVVSNIGSVAVHLRGLRRRTWTCLILFCSSLLWFIMEIVNYKTEIDGGMIQFKHQSKKKSVQLALQNCLSESEHHVLTQEEVEEEAVLWANLKRNFYTNFLLKLLTDAVMVLWESSEGFFVPAILSEVCKPRICDRLICADYIPEAAPDPDIVVSKGSVSNDNTGGEGSGLGDVGNEVFAYDDVA